MRYLLLLLLALPASAPVLAQGQPVPAATALAAGAPAAPDTAAAIHRLFTAKRRKRTVVLTTTLGVGGTMLYGTTQVQNIGNGALLGLGCLVAAPAALIELLVYNSRYSHRREQQALAAWQAQQLPPHLRKQLKAAYFQPIASEMARHHQPVSQ